MNTPHENTIPSLKSIGLYTDYYELTMAQGYFLGGRKNTRAVFDYFFRALPFGGGYVVFAGLSDLLEMLRRFRFDDGDCEYLESVGFDGSFTAYLKDLNLRLTIFAPKEGELIFPNEPVMRIEGTLIETQLIETILLNVINFESLIATKAARIRYAAGENLVADFGLRRAQSLGGVHASKAAVIGGVDSTSNVFSAKLYGLKPSGTQAHSWVQSFDSELEAFRQFARYYPERCVLLVDTFNTLNSGVPNAITVAKEMESRGQKLRAIRLDSGDLAYLSKHARRMLDEAGLRYVQIYASNQLDEYIIRSLRTQNAPIDGFGVGTRLVTGRDDAALDGVYKISMIDSKPILKISDDIEKMTLPGKKKIFRYVNGDGVFNGDAVVLDGEGHIDRMYHPHKPDMSKRMDRMQKEDLLTCVLEEGRATEGMRPVHEIAQYVRERMNRLSEEHKRFEFPHIYKVGISRELLDMRTAVVRAQDSNEFVPGR